MMTRCALVIVASILFLAGCGQRVPPVPASARGQAPIAGVAGAWRAQGRLHLAAPGFALSVRVLLRRETSGVLHLALLEDSGVVLAELAIAAEGDEVRQIAERLAPWRCQIADLARQGYLDLRPPTPPAWEDDRLVATHMERRRWFGGDPVLLRWVEGGDAWPVAVEDWRLVDGRLVPHEVRAEGPWGVTITLRLKTWSAASPSSIR